jgi:iron complex outermembrane receptor protein
MKHFTYWMSITCALGALTGAGLAAAAETAADTTAVAPDAQLDEIVITAERRESTVQKSSVVIDVLSAQQLEGVTGGRQLSQLDPGVQIGQTGANLQIYIRGVGDNTSNARSQPGVPFNLDGVYLPRGTQAAGNFFDLDRVEILKGPQGTLYGRNASGGTINLITNRPNFNGYSANFDVDLGNYAERTYEGAVNLPVASTLALRGAFQVNDADNYTTDSGSQSTVSFRGRALWQPVESFSIMANIDNEHVSGEPLAQVPYPSDGPNPWRSVLQPPYPWAYQFNPTTAPYTAPTDSLYRNNVTGESLEANWHTPFGTLTVLPALRRQDQVSITYGTNFRFVDNPTSIERTFEVRFANQIDRFNYVVGYYHYGENFRGETDPIQGTFNLAVYTDNQIKSNAAFGQTTFSVIDRLRLIAGVRYTEEQQSGFYQGGHSGYPLVPFTPTTPIDSVSPITAVKVTAKGGVEFDLTDQSMLYATIGDGFKGGGFVGTTECGAASWKPEELTAYEFGSRNRFLDNRLQVNGEVYKWKYTNQQISALALDRCGVPGFFTFNIGQANIYGASSDIVAKPTRLDTARFGVEYSHGTYDNFRLTQLGPGAYAPANGSKCSVAPSGGGLFTADCDGEPLIRLPTWSGNGGYEHLIPLWSDYNIALRASYVFASARWMDIGYLPNGRAKGYIKEDADVVFNAKHWAVALWAKNLSNVATYESGGSISNSKAPNGYLYYSDAIDPPRTFGVRATVRF